MFTYTNILKDEQVLNLYNKIEETTNYVISHGIIHVKNVLKLCKNIANELNLTNKEKHLLYISAMLHDIGRHTDNKTHNLTSEIFAKSYLKNKLPPKDIDTVCNAIKYHCQESAEFEKMDNIAYCLILADKLDFSKKRLLKPLMHQAENPRFNRLKFCNKVEIKIKNKTLIIEITQNNKELKDIILYLDKQGFSDLLKHFTNHFNLKDYKYKFINK